MESMGAEHVSCEIDGVVVDRAHKVVTTPAYMLEGDIAQVATGIERGLDAFCELL